MCYEWLVSGNKWLFARTGTKDLSLMNVSYMYNSVTHHTTDTASAKLER